MLDTIAGLPVHPLVIHLVVVLAPLTALLLIAYAVAPRLRRGTLDWLLPILALGTGFGGWLAAESGEKLEHRLEGTETDKAALDLIHQHAENGDLAKVLCLVLMAATLVLWFLLRSRLDRPVRRALAVSAVLIALLAGGASTYQILVTGHSGAKSVWGDVAGG